MVRFFGSFRRRIVRRFWNPLRWVFGPWNLLHRPFQWRSRRRRRWLHFCRGVKQLGSVSFSSFGSVSISLGAVLGHARSEANVALMGPVRLAAGLSFPISALVFLEELTDLKTLPAVRVDAPGLVED